MENKFQHVKEKLKESILAGQYKVNDKLPTESELMALYNVSRYTVRRAIGDLESEHFVYRIQGGGMFVQDWHKDWSNDNESKLIGIITTHLANYIFPDIISGIDRVLSEKGYSLLLSNTHNNHEKERKSLISMLDTKVAGLIVEPTQSALENPNIDLYREIKEDKLPTLFINAEYPEFSFPSVTTNDETAENRLVNYLFEMGHESILGLFQVDDIQGVNRMNGFVRAYQQYPNFSYKSNFIMYQSSDDINQVINRIDMFLNEKSYPTAIVCYNDQLAIRVIDYLKEKSIAVPADVSVVGFDNYQMVQYMSPSLTTMNHEKDKMGEEAGRLMIEMLEGKTVESVRYDPELIKRNSVEKLN
ncbi:GntR family transcriptional regulator [Secundilactobacillus malefermentans]|uniref:GntR family transcriptional regulator n=1 Tax=Secundilactobacillus malefermentans TaxID=176292 RepID=UPI0011C70B9C|nr:GntR family transcriptional regulator [Secundilactobacillus malefermentans]QEA31780.1 GntR family transcriptional regulator [Secundilactobacillus malefermentans]